MTRRTGGLRARTRHKFSKKKKDQGKISLTRLTQKFDIDDKVIINQETAIQKGMPHHRFKNKAGTVIGQRGKSYLVKLKDGNKEKTIKAWLCFHPSKNPYIDNI